MSRLAFSIKGIGVWTPWHSNWNALADTLRNRQASADNTMDENGNDKPVAAIIPANERRRAPLPVKLAIEASAAACEDASEAAGDLKTVFVSGLGDTQLTDYMCRALASDNKALSPTRFHNSVHNAAAGYWTISTGCTLASSSVAAYEESFSTALLEAVVQANEEQSPILLTCYDAPVAEALTPILRNTFAFAVSLVIHPGTTEPMQYGQLELDLLPEPAIWPTATWCNTLNDCYEVNPSAKVLALLNMLARQEHSVRLPLGSGTSLHIGTV